MIVSWLQQTKSEEVAQSPAEALTPQQRKRICRMREQGYLVADIISITKIESVKVLDYLEQITVEG